MQNKSVKFFRAVTALAMLTSLVLGLITPITGALALTPLQHPGAPPPVPATTAPGPFQWLTYDPSAYIQETFNQNRNYIKDHEEWWFRYTEYQKSQWEMRFMLTVMGTIIDTLAYVAQQLSYKAAQIILAGMDGEKPSFHVDQIDDFLENTANAAASKFLTEVDTIVGDYTEDQTGIRIGLCTPIDPLQVRLSLGIPRAQLLSLGGTCTLSMMAENWEAIGDMVSSGDAIQMQQASFEPGANDLDVALSVSGMYNKDIIKTTGAKLEQRKEAEGMKPVLDAITGKIKFPSVASNEAIKNLDPVSINRATDEQRQSMMIEAYWQGGIESIPYIALNTFTNTLLLGILDKIFNPKSISGTTAQGGTEYELSMIGDALENYDASGEAVDLFERKEFAKALGDYIIPNYNSREERDIVGDLSVCVTPRGRWGCSMDQSFAVAIQAQNAAGALTVGKALGIGNENSSNAASAQGLHADWELIPESDIKNNTDPSCYQRAYCAGNLKKLRLARIVPIGWEMAANSPYNIKKSGKYITLGDVVRGFYDCNDSGLLDAGHPWCHLIDPNWVLTSPNYICRTRGYGDTLIPESGARLEECGDVVTCLGSDQKGECVNGYGYCLAEKPVYRFDAPECKEQYASCRTYNYSKGQLSALRFTLERGACSEGNQGCMWYSTERYVTSTQTPDGLWKGTSVSGPRVYFDATAEPCTDDGCRKTYEIDQGQSSLNLLANGSFEDFDATYSDTGELIKVENVKGWEFDDYDTSNFSQDGYDGSWSLRLRDTSNGETEARQYTIAEGNRYYAFNFKSKGISNERGYFYLAFYDAGGVKITTGNDARGDCTFLANGNITGTETLDADDWTSKYCQFVTPAGTAKIMVAFAGYDDMYVDAVQLEEGEFVTDFVDGLAADLRERYLKFAPDEYGCTGNDDTDNPACQRYAKVCQQTQVGCQGYMDLDDEAAPEIPAILSMKDLCPMECSGYAEYRKLPSTFDLVNTNIQDDIFSDTEDDTINHLIPQWSQMCTLAEVGCEAFTNMEAAGAGGETVDYYSDIRLCEKPNDMSATYFTWEGSDETGYQLKTWSLIASTTNANDHGPKLVLKGATFGSIKDPASCNEASWKSGTDPDCRQFYDKDGVIYFNYYSQTVTSDASCTLYRKNDSTVTDCVRTGGKFEAASKSCSYDVMPSESASCPATAGGCRAYLGATGRNSTQIFNEDFKNADSAGWFIFNAPNTVQQSLESLQVGDQSVKLESTGAIDAAMSVPVPSTSTLYTISFWAKSMKPQTSNPATASVLVDGEAVGTFKPDINWQRFEMGPFKAKGTAQKASAKVTKTCGNFVFTADAAYTQTVKTANPDLSDEGVEALVNLDLQANFVNPTGVCALDTQCQNIDINNGTVSLGKANGTCGFSGATANVQITAPAGVQAVYLDNIRIVQLNDVQFIRRNSWIIPAFCDATYPEGLPEPRAMLGCRAYADRDGNTAYVREFSRLCRDEAIGCKAFVDTQGSPEPYSETKTFTGTKGPSPRQDGLAHEYEEQFLGDWSIASKPFRYYYAIDDTRGRCSADQNMCRAFGKPVFAQDRLSLATTSVSGVGAFETVLMKDDWNKYADENGQPVLACRKDELFCDKFTSGNITEYFRDPGTHSCTWQSGKKLSKNDAQGIYSDGEYNGWFREGTDVPCYPPSLIDPGRPVYQKNGDSYGAYYTGEDPYAGWAGKCPVDQSECTEFVDPNDKSDSSQPWGRSYYLINSNKLDKSSCGGTVDPLNGCVLFNNTNVGGVSANAEATYASIENNRGQAQGAIDCEADSENPVCKRCGNFVMTPRAKPPSQTDYKYQLFLAGLGDTWMFETVQAGLGDKICTTDSECSYDLHLGLGKVTGTCQAADNDSNVVLKVKLDRECSRWMGCRTGETVYDQSQQKFVTQCNDLELCEKNGSQTDDIYCSQFTDRKYEQVLKPGQFMSMEAYSQRKTGFGATDYSGFSIPYAYILSDIEQYNVGADLTGDNLAKDYYEQDRRLSVLLDIDGKNIINHTDNTFTGLDDLCQDTRTGRIGYINKNNKCVLPINDPAGTALVAGGQTGTDTSRDVQNIYKEFTSLNAGYRNSLLQSSFPDPECQLYPEEDAPLSNEYVQSWNSKANPPQPKTMLDGYSSAKSCVYGEDCSCSYRKVRYESGNELYYALDGVAPAVGICMGGDKAGEACVPGGYVAVDAQNTVLVNAQSSAFTGVGGSCGGGQCVSIQDVVVYNGKYAYCLERDKTRTGSASLANAPCLTWSPFAVIGGSEDTTHYSPTAGYMPPQGSGEYYCASGANEQRLETPSVFTSWGGNCDSAGGCGGENFLSPGHLKQFAFARSDVWWAHDDYDNISIDGGHNYLQGEQDAKTLDRIKVVNQDGTVVKKDGDQPINESDIIKGPISQNMRFACRRASLCEGYDMSWGGLRYPENGGGLDANDVEARWIMTGDSLTSSYLEYFIPEGNSMKFLNEEYFDYRYGLFRFSLEPYGAGVACKWNPKWLGMNYPATEQTLENNFSCSSYLQQLQQTSQQFYSQFKQDFNGILDRNSEQLMMDERGVPTKMKCAVKIGGTCYYKYWETGFHDDGQQSFVWPERVFMSKVHEFDFRTEYRQYYAQECRSGQPYFAIRAMFQNMNSRDNSLVPEEAKEVGLDGPWQFIGFWVTACAPTKTAFDPAWMYMRLDVVRADVCKEVAQVIAPHTRESATFANRVWSQGKFFLPALGINYESANAPFGSSLATGKIGTDPMLLGASVPLSGNISKSPVFVDSGVGVSAILSQQNSWVPLTNLFAKVYKVYRWDPMPVLATDMACIYGSQKGKLCYGGNKLDQLRQCSDYASCDQDVDVSIINQNWRCNALSGVNRGLHCGDVPYPARNLDVTCHNSAMAWKFNEETLTEETTPLLAACKVKGTVSSMDLGVIDGSVFGMCNQGLINVGGVNFCSGWSISGDDDMQIRSDEEGLGLTYSVNSDYNAIDNDPRFEIKVKARKCGESYYASLSAPEELQRYHFDTPILMAYGYWKMELDDACANHTDASGESLAREFKDNIINKYYSGDHAPFLRYKDTVTTLVDYGSVTPSDDQIIQGMNNVIDKIWLDQPPGLIWKSPSDLPLSYHFGPWSYQSMVAFGALVCDSNSIRAGEPCGAESSQSYDCPVRIQACVGGYQDMTYNGIKVPKCGYCETSQSDIYNINYTNKSDGTGYCKGFNPLARCKSNNDCTFTEFEHWGAYDEGGAQGKDYANAVKLSKLTWSTNEYNAGTVISPESLQIPTARLPMPLFTGGNNKQINIVPDKYAEGMIISNFTDQPIEGLDFGSMNLDQVNTILYAQIHFLDSTSDGLAYELSPLYKYCPNKAVLRSCLKSAMRQWGDEPTLYATTLDHLNGCIKNCNQAAFMIPNSYASNFIGMPQAGMRTAAVAPFAVNPLIRTINSVGTFVSLHGGASSPYGFIMGQLFSDTSLKGWGSSHPIISAISQSHVYNSLATTINERVNGISTTQSSTIFINDTFPWDTEKLFFTSIFPLIDDDYGGVRQLDGQLGIWFSWEKIWLGYGMSEDLFVAFKAYLAAVISGSSDSHQKLNNFMAIYKNDFRENFIAKTGWGSFISPSDKRLQLYPGAIPAAVLKEQKPIYPGAMQPPDTQGKYTVYIPGHCEPPAGGTDTDSLIADLMNVITPDETYVKKGMITYAGMGNTKTYYGHFQNAWMPVGEQYYQDSTGPDGFVDPSVLVWIQPYLSQRPDTDSQNIPIDSDVWGPIKNARSTCRCVGGARNGSVQESQADCNMGLPDSLNPDKYSGPNDPALSGLPEYCKYVSNADGTPIAECKGLGTPGDSDPDLDDNICTHNSGYIPRGDVCADGRENCLITYDLSDPISTNHKTISKEQQPAPSATDVTSGLDAYSYITGGRVQKLSKEYSVWYRPMPPRIAAPDSTKASQSANALPISIVDAFSLDGLPQGLVYYGGGQGKSTIRFYAWAAHEQGPVKEVIIDWGDGTVQHISDAQMKNNKPICNTDRECEFVSGLACSSDADCPAGTGACKQKGVCEKRPYKECSGNEDCGNDDKCSFKMMFGNSNEACTQGYLEFSHVYKCNEDDLNMVQLEDCERTNRCSMEPDRGCLNANSCRPGEECVSGLAPRGGCFNEALNRCRYTPRVMVKDNWGWCTGDCSRDDEVTPGSQAVQADEMELLIRHPYGGCYDGSDTKINSDVAFNPQYAKELPNECKPEYVSSDQYSRPWVVFGGSVEVSYTKRAIKLDTGPSSFINQIVPNSGGLQFNSVNTINPVP